MTRRTLLRRALAALAGGPLARFLPPGLLAGITPPPPASPVTMARFDELLLKHYVAPLETIYSRRPLAERLRAMDALPDPPESA